MPIAAAAIVVLTGVNYLGVSKTARVTRVLVALALVALAGVVAASFGGGAASPAHLTEWAPHGTLGIAQAAALLFFAFAGYARIATLGEEVRAPERTISRAIPLALVVVVAIYALVGLAALMVLGPQALVDSRAPLAATSRAGGFSELAIVVRIGGVVASVGVLLSLMAGIGRTSLVMARDRELPRWLVAVHPRHHVPHRADLLLGALVLIIVLIADIRGAIGFSSFAVLLYYALANASAFTLPGRQRRWLRPLTVLGFAGCVLLAATLPLTSVLTGAGVLLVGLLVRGFNVRFRRGRAGAVV